jgi:hypothetical protein
MSEQRESHSVFAKTSEEFLEVKRRNAQLRQETTAEVKVIRTLGELAGLPLGTRIATNHNKLLILDTFAGAEWWFEEAGLQPYSALVEWLPVIVLPPVADRADPPPPLATGTVCELRMEDDDEES